MLRSGIFGECLGVRANTGLARLFWVGKRRWRLPRMGADSVYDAPNVEPPPAYRPAFPARVPRCGHGRRSLGSRKGEKAANRVR